jgi:hypothetical protein
LLSALPSPAPAQSCFETPAGLPDLHLQGGSLRNSPGCADSRPSRSGADPRGRRAVEAHAPRRDGRWRRQGLLCQDLPSAHGEKHACPRGDEIVCRAPATTGHYYEFVFQARFITDAYHRRDGPFLGGSECGRC